AFRSKPVPGCLLPGKTDLQGYIWQRSNFRCVAAWDARRPQGRTRLIQELVDQIEIIVSLMQLNDSRIDRYGVCQQPAASVPAVTCANRNPGEPDQKGGFKGILKKKRGIEMRPPQGLNQFRTASDATMLPLSVVNQYLVDAFSLFINPARPRKY